MAVKNNSEVNAKAHESAKKAVESLSEGVIYAITMVAPHVRKGVFWGFTNVRDAKEHYDSIKADQNVTAYKIKDSVIVEVNPSYLIQAVSYVDPNMFDNEAIQKMQNNMAEAVVEFQKFLINHGISSPMVESVIGVYSVNDVTTIAVKGKNFPAFRLNIDKALHLLARMGYEVNVGGRYVPAQSAFGSPAIWESMELAPTKTGVFLKVRSTYSPEQMKTIKKQLKQQMTANR